LVGLVIRPAWCIFDNHQNITIAPSLLIGIGMETVSVGEA